MREKPLNINEVAQLKTMYEQGMDKESCASFFDIDIATVESWISIKGWKTPQEVEQDKQNQLSAKKIIEEAEKAAEERLRAAAEASAVKAEQKKTREQLAAQEELPEYIAPESLNDFPVMRRKKELKAAHRKEMNEMRKRLHEALHKLDHTQFPDIVAERLKAIKVGVEVLRTIHSRESELSGMKEVVKKDDGVIRVTFGDDSPAVSKTSIEEDE